MTPVALLVLRRDLSATLHEEIEPGSYPARMILRGQLELFSPAETGAGVPVLLWVIEQPNRPGEFSTAEELAEQEESSRRWRGLPRWKRSITEIKIARPVAEWDRRTGEWICYRGGDMGEGDRPSLAARVLAVHFADGSISQPGELSYER